MITQRALFVELMGKAEPRTDLKAERNSKVAGVN